MRREKGQADRLQVTTIGYRGRVLSWDQVRARRLNAGCLVEAAPADHMVNVASRVCGLQAQVLTAAELGLGVRVKDITRRDVQAALWEQRTLVKTYGPRDTVHLLPAGEISLWNAARSAVMDRCARAWYADYKLDAEQVEAVLDALGQALDGRCLTRAELANAVSERIGSWAQSRLASTWVDLLGVGFDAGLLCFGPNRGSQVTFVLLEQWIGSQDRIEPEHALRIVCRRFFKAYGPATPREFAQWFAPRHLTVRKAAQVVGSVAADLEEVEVEGHRCWLPAGESERSWETERSTVLLLPQYDCYLLGSRFGRDTVVPAVARQRISRYKNGRFEGAVGVSVLLVDGVVSGIWEQRRRGKRIEIHVQPFVRLTPGQEAMLEGVVQRSSSFLGSPVAISIDPDE